MKQVSQTKQFSRDINRMRKRGKDLEKLQEIVKLLAEGTPLPPHNRDHPLIGQWQ
jgi:mRNA interferase YafQ